MIIIWISGTSRGHRCPDFNTCAGINLKPECKFWVRCLMLTLRQRYVCVCVCVVSDSELFLSQHAFHIMIEVRDALCDHKLFSSCSEVSVHVFVVLQLDASVHTDSLASPFIYFFTCVFVCLCLFLSFTWMLLMLVCTDRQECDQWVHVWCLRGVTHELRVTRQRGGPLASSPKATLVSQVSCAPNYAKMRKIIRQSVQAFH